MDVGEEVVKVYVMPPPVDSWVLKRVADALIQYAPHDIDIVSSSDGADLVVLQIIGRQDRNWGRVTRLKGRGQRYAIVQFCLRSTRRPLTENWFPLWRDAVLTWSYYDLKALCAEDGTPQDFPFYHAPLGVDATVFYPRDYPQRQYVIATSGLSAVTESIREADFAARRVGRLMFHLGHELNRGTHITCARGMDDDILAKWLSQCEFVAGLRRTEGFELLAAEGLLCGARPICFDQPHYRQWFGPWAIFIPEGSREQVIDSLEGVFRSGAEPVTEEERNAAKVLFDWDTIIAGFWNRTICVGGIRT